MRTLRNFCAAAVLSLALAASASAGTIWIGVVNPPPPPPSEGIISTDITDSPSTQGDTQPGLADQGGGTEAAASDSAASVALNLLQSVLSLF
jgi:hypothetical protein